LKEAFEKESEEKLAAMRARFDEETEVWFTCRVADSPQCILLFVGASYAGFSPSAAT